MPLEIVRGDIAEVEAEAAAVELSIAPGGRAKQMLDKMKESFGLDTPLEPGMADIELAKSGRTRFIIRAAIPKWQGGGAGEQDALAKGLRQRHEPGAGVRPALRGLPAAGHGERLPRGPGAAHGEGRAERRSRERQHEDNTGARPGCGRSVSKAPRQQAAALLL